VKVRRGLEEDPDAARERHFAAHPEDRDANIVIFDFFEVRSTDKTSPFSGGSSTASPRAWLLAFTDPLG
jgi:hypothetical protein